MNFLKLVLVAIKAFLVVADQLVDLAKDAPDGRSKVATVVLVLSLVVSFVLAIVSTPLPVDLLFLGA